MSGAATSILTWGIYLVILGPGLMIAPDALLGLFGVPDSTDGWIRVVGMLLFLLGLYYVLAARAELRAFFRWSVWVRAAVLPLFATLTFAGFLPPILLGIGFVDLAGAAWTAVALRRSERGEPAR